MLYYLSFYVHFCQITLQIKNQISKLKGQLCTFLTLFLNLHYFQQIWKLLYALKHILPSKSLGKTFSGYPKLPPTGLFIQHTGIDIFSLSTCQTNIIFSKNIPHHLDLDEIDTGSIHIERKMLDFIQKYQLILKIVL